jgi:hypothetical protein
MLATEISVPVAGAPDAMVMIGLSVPLGRLGRMQLTVVPLIFGPRSEYRLFSSHTIGVLVRPSVTTT